jgi:EpsI family protein
VDCVRDFAADALWLARGDPLDLAGESERMKNTTARFALAAILIATTALFLHAHNRQEILPPRLPLASFPAQIGSLNSSDIPIDKDQLEVLGKGEFLHRAYDDGERPFIDLFIAFYPSQRTGETPHSPQNCLPGSGWAPRENTRIHLQMPGHLPFPVNRYIIAKGDSRELVLYWFWAHNRGVASEYWNKFYLVSDSIKMNRSDGSLIRIISPVQPGETTAAAQQRITPFVNQVLPLLNDYIPR